MVTLCDSVKLAPIQGCSFIPRKMFHQDLSFCKKVLCPSGRSGPLFLEGGGRCAKIKSNINLFLFNQTDLFVILLVSPRLPPYFPLSLLIFFYFFLIFEKLNFAVLLYSIFLFFIFFDDSVDKKIQKNLVVPLILAPNLCSAKSPKFKKNGSDCHEIR